MSVVNSGERCVQEVIRVIFNIFGVEVAFLNIRVDGLVVVRDELLPGLVVEPLAEHVHQDNVLPIPHPQARGAGAIKDGTARHPLEIAVAILTSDLSGLGNIRAEFAGLVVQAPQRCPD